MGTRQVVVNVIMLYVPTRVYVVVCICDIVVECTPAREIFTHGFLYARKCWEVIYEWFQSCVCYVCFYVT